MLFSCHWRRTVHTRQLKSCHHQRKIGNWNLLFKFLYKQLVSECITATAWKVFLSSCPTFLCCLKIDFSSLLWRSNDFQQGMKWRFPCLSLEILGYSSGGHHTEWISWSSHSSFLSCILLANKDVCFKQQKTDTFNSICQPPTSNANPGCNGVHHITGYFTLSDYLWNTRMK